jgi:O-antigen/teichoic acid export membrane protein
MVKLDQAISLRTIAIRSSVLIGSKTVQDGLLFLLFIWLARTDQSGYGLISLGMSVVMILRALQSLGLDQYTLRELFSSKIQASQLLKQMAMAKLFIAGITILIFLVFALVKQWPFHQIGIIFILLSGQCFEGIADTFFNLFRAEGRTLNESICRTIPNVIASLYGAGCLYHHLDILFFSFLFFLSGSLKFGAAVYSVCKLHGLSFIRGIRFRLGQSSIFSLILFSGINFFGMFYNEIQIFWLKQYHTFIAIALYRTAFDMTASICGVVAQIIFGAVLFPQLINIFHNNSKEEFQKIVGSYFFMLITLGSGMSLFLAFFGGTILLIIYGDQYCAAAPLVPWFAAAAFLSFINNFIINVFLAMREEKHLFCFLLLPVSISIILGPVLIGKTGPTGAAISLLLSRLVLTILLVAALQKNLRFLKFVDYKNVVYHWLIACIVFCLFIRVNFFLASGLALFSYFLLILFAQRSAGKRIGKDDLF